LKLVNKYIKKMRLKPLSSIFRFQKGFGLLETVVAIFIITIGLIGGLSLAISSTTAARNVRERFVAYSLAQEGLELVHNYRDSVWLAEQDGFAPGQTMENDGEYALDYTGLIEERGVAGDYKLHYENGFYRHDAGAATQYSRFVTTQTQGNSKIIVSQVSWANQELKLELHLYNWRDF